MLDFVYNTPTKVFFGKNTQAEVGKIIKDYGYTKIMIQYGKTSIKKSGLYDQVVSSLNENGIKFVEMGGVEPNPKVEFVRDAICLAKRENVELILAVGGGSVIDSCKATALGAKYDGDVWDIFSRKHVPTDALPTACILTISAAGSEMSSSAVITNSSLNIKRGCNTEFNRCKFAILNPELTYSVSKYQTACGIVDMMSASSLSHNGLTGCGRENFLAVHQLEHAVSGVFDAVAHGAGLAVLYPAWAKYVYKYNAKRFARLARNVWGVDEKDDERCALKGIEAMQNFFIKLKMPSRLSEFNITKESIPKLVEICTLSGQRTIKSYIPLCEKELTAIFELCL